MLVSILHGERRTRQLVVLAIQVTPAEGPTETRTVELRPAQSYEFCCQASEIANVVIAAASKKDGRLPVHIALQADAGEVIPAKCLAYAPMREGEAPDTKLRGAEALHEPATNCLQANVTVHVSGRLAAGVAINGVLWSRPAIGEQVPQQATLEGSHGQG